MSAKTYASSGLASAGLSSDAGASSAGLSAESPEEAWVSEAGSSAAGVSSGVVAGSDSVPAAGVLSPCGINVECGAGAPGRLESVVAPPSVSELETEASASSEAVCGTGTL